MQSSGPIGRVFSARSTGNKLGFLISRPGAHPSGRFVTANARSVMFSEQHRQVLIEAGDHILTGSQTMVTIEFFISGHVTFAGGTTHKIIGERQIVATGATLSKQQHDAIVGIAKDTGKIVVGTVAFCAMLEIQAALATGTAIGGGIAVTAGEALQFLGLATAHGALNQLKGPPEQDGIDFSRAGAIRG